MSDLVLVRSVQPAGEDRDATNPLEFSSGKVTPELNATIAKSNGAAEGLYFVLYPGQGASPEVQIAMSHNGQLVSSTRASLPPAEADGSIRGVSRIAFGSLDPAPTRSR